MELKDEFKAEAKRLGFELVGITAPQRPEHYAVFESWLEAGRHGEMAYLASERSRLRRADPRQILAECRSILVLGKRYPTPEKLPHDFNRERQKAQPPTTLQGKVAAYAWMVDYHDWLPSLLDQLAHFIETQTGRPISQRGYTDSGPILERDLAQQAGLGWIGKNTCLIHPKLGSYFFLAEILLDLELPPDPPFSQDGCGACTRCIDACPTACILPDRTLDARRCISYLTIELKGAIPGDLRAVMGERIFGCDVCQQVCPWNRRFARPLPAQPAPFQPDLIEELALSASDFKQRFKPDPANASPVLRAKRRGYLRNVATALGNTRDERAILPLAHALAQDAEPLVRAHAAWALGQFQPSAARSALEEALQSEKDDAVRKEISLALGRFENL